MRRLAFLLLAILLLLSACGYQISSPARTEVPIYLAPVVHAPIQTRTPTPDYSTFIQMGQEVAVPEKGYAFTPILVARENGPTYETHFFVDEAPAYNTTGRFTSITAGDSGLGFSIWQYKTDQITDEPSCLAYVLKKSYFLGSQYSFTAYKAITLPIGTAQSTRISGINNEFHATGEIVFQHSEHGCLVFVGESTNAHEDDVTLWNNIGKPAFDKMLQSLRFLTPEEMALCHTALIESYGFSPEDPIPVGNSNLYDGREREELYLLTLRGPNGEEIIFQRQSPIFNKNGEIVDPYQIQYGSSPATTLYFTIYRYQEPLYLPIGYTCEAAFPLSNPIPQP